jgi:hypothetical protein
VGAFEPDGPQRYGNPESPWFNVFLGYYQLDCARAEWDRPFGFASAAGADSAPVVEDLTRLGKSDWNYFSNWDYGVPEDVCRKYCGVDLRPDDHVDGGLVEVAGRRWHRFELRNVEVVTAYESDVPGARRLVSNTLTTPITRQSYGPPCPSPDFPSSFFPKKLDGVFHMAYVDDGEYWRTLIFGGTAHAGEDRALLDAEVAATLAVIADQYAEFGFA